MSSTASVLLISPLLVILNMLFISSAFSCHSDISLLSEAELATCLAFSSLFKNPVFTVSVEHV